MDTQLRDVLPQWTAAARARRRAATFEALEKLERACADLAKETSDLDAAVEIGKATRHVRKTMKRLEGEK